MIAKRLRLVKSRDGEYFAETPAGEWQKTLAAATGRKSKPYPMPVGHWMFRSPAEYGAALIAAKRTTQLSLQVQP